MKRKLMRQKAELAKLREKFKYEIGGFESMYNTALYFWVASIDKWAGKSSKVASAPTNAMIFKGQSLVHFSTPWRMGGATRIRKVVAQNQSDTYTVPSGHCALICGYHLDRGGAGGTATLWVNNLVVESATTATIIMRSPGATNGMYIEYGDHLDIGANNTAGAHGEVTVLEFNSDADVSVVVTAITPHSTYTVTAGKTLYLTYIATWYGTPNYLVVDGVSVWDIENELWNLGKGVLQFPAGSELGTDADDALIFGVEVKSN